MTTIRPRWPCTALTVCAALSGCVINPVTGDRELALVSAGDEVSIGENQYLPARQMQGGDYVVDPALTDYVSGVGQRVAAVSDRALPYEFAVLNSSVPNAWALPGGKIAINRGLLVELESEAELAAVLGHEVVHAAARHGALAMQRGMLLQGAVLAAAVATRGNDYSNLAIGAAGLGAQLINQRYGRSAELESDLYGMRYMAEAGYDPDAAVSLQQTFVRLSEGSSQGGWLEGLFASHPPSAERVARNRETAASLPSGGELGEARYAAAIRPLVQSQPAYDAYDRGRTALAEDRLDEAEALAREAAESLPAEGHFHALLGDIDSVRRQPDAALGHYRDAMARNDAYFYYSLRAGLMQLELGDLDAAGRNLEASTALLPTADAFLGLGRIAERRGDRATALERYAQAAQSSSAAGQAAQDAVVRLELPEQPERHLTLRTGLDSAGGLRVEIGNPTRVPVTDIVLVVRYRAADGAVRELSRTLSGTLAPNAAQSIDTGLGPFASAEQYQVTVAAARAADE